MTVEFRPYSVQRRRLCQVSMEKVHWNGKAVILTTFLPLAALKVLKMITFNEARGENVIKMTAFLFQCLSPHDCHPQTYKRNIYYYELAQMAEYMF